jgi:hypothetical protein
MEHLMIGSQEYWHIDKIKPYKSIPVANPLPSDPRYREDVLWVRRENEHNAQIWKNYLELQQRYERKIRIEKSRVPIKDTFVEKSIKGK